MRSWFVLAVALSPVLPAQRATTPPDTGTLPPTQVERTITGSYSESTSRDLFSACDGDGDDRLDVFETADALETMRGAKDANGFARLDRDRDGYITWPEFDQHFRNSLRRDGLLRLRPCRPGLLPTPAPQAASPLQQFLRLHDTDQNGGLDPDEVDRYLEKAGLPPTLGGVLRTQDLDQSGRIEEAELAPWFERLVTPNPLLALFNAARPPTVTVPLLPPWTAADENRDGRIDEAELGRVLRRLDPALERWLPHLLQALDKNGDGKLDAEEIPGAAAKKRTTAAKGPAPLPVDAPLR